MKMVGIDIDALQSQAATLREQLSGIETVIRIASGSGISMPDPPRAPQERPQTQPAVRIESRKMTNVGARKAVLLALHTGPASVRDIGRALVWDQGKVRDVLYSMLAEKIASVGDGGIYALSDQGTKMARWHIENPHYLTYCASKVLAAKA